MQWIPAVKILLYILLAACPVDTQLIHKIGGQF